ncbi:hypothetical protein AVEN_157975-1 [Araneus ventricosus]|uniref:RNase H type-1 domain-containing protein n=1 Tax=Araneus ventricosus TaxID=182803 RepID=A0A4Y2KKF2_ARAVE|nr:hypothetical protein AVEN_157975-1 [Araneus ventricosus]
MVGLSWVKAHVGIPGNELADQQTKLAITSGEKFVIPAPYSHLKGLLKNCIVNKWNEYWNSYDSASGIRVRGYINQFLGVGFSRRPVAAIGPLAPTIDDCSNSRVSPQFWKPVATLSMP